MSTAGSRLVLPGPVSIETDPEPAEWDGYVRSRSEGTIYHLSRWADVMRDVFRHRTQYLAARQDGRLVGVLPLVLFRTPLFGRFATSMPFLNYGGVLADTQEAAEALLAAGIAATRAGGLSYLELRHTRRQFPSLPVLTHKVAMTLALRESADAQWAALDRKLRNQVRKAEKSGLTTRVGGMELVDPFYDVLAENMRDLGSPVHGPEFYERILKAFPDRTRVLCVFDGETPVAGSFVLWHGDSMEVPWASSLRRYNPLCPNVLLYWEMLRLAIATGLRQFDFGRSTPHEGTYQFKAQWGAEPQQLYWEYWLAEGVSLPNRSPKNEKFNRVIAIWQELPVAVTRVIGPPLVRNIP